MRFDLEIPSTCVDLTYISEGNKIPASVVPLYYVDIDYRDKLPQDFLTINENIVEDPTSELVFEEQDGPSFGLRGNRFLLTNVSKYSMTHNAMVPIFHKLVLDEQVSEFSIKITDNLGEALDRSEYIVEVNNGKTVIFMNKQGKVFFIEFISDNKTVKRLISLAPVFSEISWDDVIRSPYDIPDRKYRISEDGILNTSHIGKLYVKYDHDIKLLQSPIANIDDSWYLGIRNVKFSKVDSEDSGITYSYEVPEFYIQNPMTQYRLEEIREKKCKVLFDNFIQTQSVPDLAAIDKTNIFIHDYYTGELKYAFTTNSSLAGTIYNNVYFILADDWNNEGVIQLPITITDSDVITSSYLVKNEYYKFRFLNLNSVEVGKDHYFSIYMKPNPQETELGVFFAIIGKTDDPNIEQSVFRQGRAFGSIEEYDAFILKYNCYHVAIIGISTSTQLGISNFTDVRRKGNVIDDKELASKASADIFYNDIMQENILLPTNDVLIATVSAKSLSSKRAMEIDGSTLEVSSLTKDYLAKIEKAVSSSLDATTQFVIEVSKNTEEF